MGYGGDAARWGIWLKLNKHQKELFGTTREVLLWVVEHREFQARTVSQAADLIEKERPRLCEDFAIVAATDLNTEKYVSETSDQLSTQFLGISIGEFQQFAPHGRLD
jgi:serine/threonine-protein kinase